MDRILTYATVCSGIECMSVACRGLPLRPVFFSEIEPFPCAVLKAHYPDVPNLGDMSKIQVSNDGKEITNGTINIRLDTRLDILAGGTPCQDVSVAGKRAGMQEGSGTRSSLAFDFVRLARELGPRFVIWENVAGAIDSKNAPDFLAFLRALGDCGYSLAWRVLDAQYVRVDSMERGLPQRRRRVWVVGCLGADESVPVQILFEPDCVAGHTAPRRRTGEGFAYSLAGRDRVDARLVGEPAGCEPAVARTLARRYNSSPCIDRGQNCIALDGDKLKPREDQRKGGNGFGVNEEGAGYTLTAVDRHGVAYETECYENHAQDSRIKPIEVSDTRNQKDGTGGNNLPLVCFSKVSHPSAPNGEGERWDEREVAQTRNTFDNGEKRCQEVVVSTNSNGEDIAPTISSCEYKMGQKQKDTGGVCRDTEPLGIGRDVFNSGANASFSPDIRVGVQPTLTARTTQGAVCARLKGDE